MEAIDLLHTHLMDECPFIHGKTFTSIDGCSLLTSKEAKSITDSDRKWIIWRTSLKHKIKKGSS